MSSKILLRRGTATQWSSANPILGNGELGIETDTLKIKIGNGTSTWSQLASYANITPSELTSAINSIIDLSPSTLDTLNELAAAINDDPNFFTSVNTSLSGKVSKSGGDTITSDTASTKGLIIKGAISQTASLLEWQDSSGNILGRFHPTAGLLIPGLSNTNGGASPYINFNTTNFTLYPNLASNIGLIIQGAASQTGDLQRWQDSSGNKLSYINASGQFISNVAMAVLAGNYGGYVLNIQASNPSYKGILVKGAASQTANLTEWQDSSGGIIGWFNAYGSFEAVNSLNGAKAELGNRGVSQASTLVLKIQGFASQTANLTEWQDSAGTVLSKVRNDGFIETTAGVSATGNYLNSFGGATLTNTILAVRPGAANIGLVVRGAASPTANLQEWQDSTGAVNASLTHNGDFRISNIYAITSFNNAQLNMLSTGPRFTTNVTTNVALTVKGAASQTADLQQWQNSSGTVLAKVTSTGMLDITPSSGSTISFRNSSGGLTFWGGNSSYYMNTGFYMTGGSWVDGRLAVDTQGAANKGLVVRGSASQTADLQQWQNSSGTALTVIRSDGSFLITKNGDPATATAAPFFYSPVNSGYSPLAVFSFWYQSGTGISNPAAQSLGINTLSIERMRFTSAGLVLINSSSSTLGSGSAASQLGVVVAEATTVGTVIRGAASQTANLQEWQDSAGAVLAKVSSAGRSYWLRVHTNLVQDFAGTGPYIDLAASTLTILPQATTQVPLTVKGLASQSANLQEWQDSTGAVITKVNSIGRMTINSSSDAGGAALYVIQPNGGYGVRVLGAGTSGAALWVDTVAGGVGAIIRAAASQTAKLQEWQNSAGTVLSSINNNGVFETTASIYTPYIQPINGGGSYLSLTQGNPVTAISASASVVPFAVKAAASQSANLQEWQNSSGTILASVTESGGIGIGTSTLGTNSKLTVSNGAIKISSGGTANADASLHISSSYGGFDRLTQMHPSVNNKPALNLMGYMGTGSVGGWFAWGVDSDGNWKINNGTSFSNPDFAVLSNATVGINTTTSLGQLGILNGSASRVGLVIRGSASQTADLQEWQNSAGTVLANITASGSLELNGKDIELMNIMGAF